MLADWDDAAAMTDDYWWRKASRIEAEDNAWLSSVVDAFEEDAADAVLRRMSAFGDDTLDVSDGTAKLLELRGKLAAVDDGWDADAVPDTLEFLPDEVATILCRRPPWPSFVHETPSVRVDAGLDLSLTGESQVWLDGVERPIVQRVVLSDDADVMDVEMDQWSERKGDGVQMLGAN